MIQSSHDLCPDLVRRARDRPRRAATAAAGTVTAAPAANAIDAVDAVEVDVLDRIDVIVAVGCVGSEPAVAAALDAARAAFAWLCRGPAPVAADGRRIRGLAARQIPSRCLQRLSRTRQRACARRPVLHEDARARDQDLERQPSAAPNPGRPSARAGAVLPSPATQVAVSSIADNDDHARARVPVSARRPRTGSWLTLPSTKPMAGLSPRHAIPASRRRAATEHSTPCPTPTLTPHRRYQVHAPNSS